MLKTIRRQFWVLLSGEESERILKGGLTSSEGGYVLEKNHEETVNTLGSLFVIGIIPFLLG